MSNNKQSSVEWLVQEINQIIDFIPMNKWDEIRGVVQQAKAMHRREHADTARDWWVEGASDARKAHTGKYESFDDYYTEKFTAEQPA